MQPEATVTLAIALQFAAFGWRVAREINVGDEGRKTWLQASDYVNIIMLLVTAALCVVLPLTTGTFGIVSRVTLAVAIVLVAFHPIVTAGYYRLLSGRGREGYVQRNQDYPYLTGEEGLIGFLAIICAVVAGWYVYAA